LNIKSDS